VTIIGDAGLGKTRLVGEFWERLESISPEPERRTGQCLAYGHGITYWPLGEVLKQQFRLSDTDSPEMVRGRLGEREVLALSLGVEVAREMHPLEARDRLHDEWVDLLAQLTENHPLVMLIEDLHWAEEPLLDLLARMARDVAGPLFIVATARPELLETRPAWGAGTRNTSQLWLEPLQAGEVRDLVQTLTTSAMPASLVADLVERAEGNPFFAEELLATFIDRGMLVEEGDRWEVSEPSGALELPDTVQAVVAARVDLLPMKEKSALQAAAVVGRTFWETPVIELLEGTRPDFELLEARDFIRRGLGSSLDGGREYVFKHAVTREVAYATVSKRRRARLHAAFAAWLEQTGGGRDEHAPLLAHHYASSVRPDEVDLAWRGEPEAAARLMEKAGLWLRRAGELAVARYDLDDGIALLRQSADFEPDELERAELWREIGRANALGFRGAEFLDAMERSLELSSDSGVRGATYAELAYQTSFRAGMWTKAPDPGDVSLWIEQGLALAEAGTAARCKALIARGFWSPTGDVAAAREASAIAEVLGDPDLRAAAYSAESRVTHRAGRHADALTLAERPLEFVGELHDPEQVLEVYEALVPIQSMLGQFDDARDVSRLHAEVTERLTAHHRVHGVAVRTEIEELCAEWQTIRGLRPRIERTVAHNLDTPCIRNQRTLLVCALAAHLAKSPSRNVSRTRRSRSPWRATTSNSAVLAYGSRS
jgi:tetratricopeptide (TPR) repeat protein